MKKSKSKTLLPAQAQAQARPLIATSLPNTELLQEIRDSALQARSDISNTIAELDAWRTEIDATIAFLKSQRKK
jgi:hypothetical protein